MAARTLAFTARSASSFASCRAIGHCREVVSAATWQAFDRGASGHHACALHRASASFLQRAFKFASGLQRAFKSASALTSAAYSSVPYPLVAYHAGFQLHPMYPPSAATPSSPLRGLHTASVTRSSTSRAVRTASVPISPSSPIWIWTPWQPKMPGGVKPPQISYWVWTPWAIQRSKPSPPSKGLICSPCHPTEQTKDKKPSLTPLENLLMFLQDIELTVDEELKLEEAFRAKFLVSPREGRSTCEIDFAESNRKLDLLIKHSKDVKKYVDEGRGDLFLCQWSYLERDTIYPKLPLSWDFSSNQVKVRLYRRPKALKGGGA